MRKTGYSLIELSVVLVIISLLTAGGLAMSTAMVDRAAYIDTKKTIDQIETALQNYYIVNGRLPCVASLTTTAGASGFGVESGATGTTCNGGLAAPAGTYRINTGSSVYVRVGMLPVRTLGLTDSTASDKYGNRIIYAVTEKLTDASTFGSSPGAITIRDMNSNNILTDAAYFVASPGQDHKGAYLYSTGSASATACGASSNLDVLNCTLTGAVYRDAPFNSGSQAAYFFDDIVRWVPKYHLTATTTESSSLWAASSDNIYSVGIDANTANTNVGIGTASPAQKLHVMGAARIDTSDDFFLYMRDLNAPADLKNWALLDVNHAGNLTLRSRYEDWTAKASLITFDHSTGYVGIGTTAPEEKLHVMGAQRIDTSDDFFMYFHSQNATVGLQNWALLDVSHAGNLTIRSRNDDWSFKSTLISMDHATGNVGIGTTDPDEGRLEVQGGAIYVGNMWLGTSSAGDTTVAPDVHMNASGLIASDDTMHINFDGTNKGTGNFYVRAGSLTTTGDQLLRVSRAGNLTVFGSGTTCSIGPGTGATSCTSDSRYKKDVTKIPDALEKLLQVRGIYYRWNEKARFKDKDTRHLGVLAQEVNSVFPEAVSKDDDGYLTVGIDALVPVLIESVRELDTENKKLKAENTALDKRLTALEKAMQSRLMGHSPAPSAK